MNPVDQPAQSLPSPPEMPLLESPKTTPILSLITAIIIFLFSFGYMMTRNISPDPIVTQLPPTPTQVPTVTPEPTPTPDPLQTYTNSEYGFSFRYPREWTTTDKPPRLVTFQTDVPTGLEIPNPQFSEFFIMHHTDIPDLEKWLKFNNAGKITGSKIIGEHTFTIVKGGTNFVDREYILHIKDTEYLRFVIEPVMKTGVGYDTTELLFDQILSTFTYTT